MSLEEALLEQGYVPKGVAPKTSIDGGTPGYHNTGAMATMARALQLFTQQQQQVLQEKQKKMKSKIDMFNTLRDSGYSPQAAFDAVEKMELPEEMPGESIKRRGEEADIKYKEAAAANMPYTKSVLYSKILTKIAEGEDLTPGEQEIYDDVITKQSDLAGLLNQTGKNDVETLKNTIQQKVANGEKLTPGQQKLYDDVIKKRESSDLFSASATDAFSPEDLVSSPANENDYIRMITPDGKPKKVHKEDVEKALKKGYKRR